MEFILKEYHRNSTDEELLNDIKRVAEKLGNDTLTMEEYSKIGKYSTCTHTRRFGSWFKVLSLAGLRPSRSAINISEEELLMNIYDVWIKLSRQPKYSEMRHPLSKYSAGTYDKRFGSWRKALETYVQYINSESTNATEEISSNQKETNCTKEKGGHKTKREISLRMRFKILMRDGFTCKKCGSSPLKDHNVTLHVDHILPWSKGGETTLDNLETKCEKCNLGKGNAFDV